MANELNKELCDGNNCLAKCFELINSQPNVEELNELYCCGDFDAIPVPIREAFDYIAEHFGEQF